jgi:hypothetical protein
LQIFTHMLISSWAQLKTTDPVFEELMPAGCFGKVTEL